MVENLRANLAPNLEAAYRSHEAAAAQLARARDFERAEAEYQAILAAIRDAQGTDRRYHKGGPYHQIGVARYLRDRRFDAMRFFLLAYVEDCFTYPGFPDTPAFKNLVNVCGVERPRLEQILEHARAVPEAQVPLNPEEHLASWEQANGAIGQAAVPRNRLVFVGGNYKNIVLIRHLEDRVMASGFHPVMPVNFSLGNIRNVYPHAMTLLAQCGLFIFEITFDAGHLMEIERALRLPGVASVDFLLLFQADKWGPPNPRFTAMLQGTGITPRSYTTCDELGLEVGTFLTSRP